MQRDRRGLSPVVPENAVYYVEVVANDVAATRALYEKAYGWRFRAEALGGKLALEPTELPGQGKIAIYLLGGIEQGLWQLP